jgi:sugar fermentation stimulation protein A
MVPVKGRVAALKKGTYLLFLQADEQVTIRVGRLGRIEFVPGIYAYTGSAMSGLEPRVGRHLRGDGKPHWHIDYLRRRTEPLGALLIPSRTKRECEINQLIDGLVGSEPYAPGFGCSDCHCWTHLHRLDGAALCALKARFGKVAWKDPLSD